MKKVLRIDTQILWICVLAVLPIGDAIAIGLDRYWDERNVETAFSPKNRHGTNPVHQAMPVGVRRDALGDAAKAEAAGSGNFLLTVPILNLPGRGLDLSLALTYNSQIWHDGGTIHFDPDHGWPAPGWSLGFGKLVRMEAAGPAVPIAMLIDSDGTRHSFRGSSPAAHTFSAHTTDGSLIDYTVYWPKYPSPRVNYGIDSAVVRYPNGTVILYTAPGDNRGFGQFASEIFPTRITDADGNYISITYRNGSGPAIDTITDTLGRKVSFHYDANNALTAISGPSLDGGTRVLIRLHYASFFNRHFRAFIDAIFYPADSTGYWFDDPDSYSATGILKVVSQPGICISLLLP